MAIVFGSPEAQAIIAKDKELQRQAEEEARRNSPEWIDDRLKEIDSEILDLQSQILHLRVEYDELRQKQREVTHSSGKAKKHEYIRRPQP